MAQSIQSYNGQLNCTQWRKLNAYDRHKRNSLSFISLFMRMYIQKYIEKELNFIFNRGEICVANFKPPCEYCKSR